LARVAQPEDEAQWLDLAAGQTLRELRCEVSKARALADLDVVQIDCREYSLGAGSARSAVPARERQATFSDQGCVDQGCVD
jgi:hypothetical protein